MVSILTMMFISVILMLPKKIKFFITKIIVLTMHNFVLQLINCKFT